MDLSNLALADPWQAADAVAVWQGTPNLARLSPTAFVTTDNSRQQKNGY